MLLHTQEITNDTTDTINIITPIDKTGLKDKVCNPNRFSSCSIIIACTKYAPKLYFDNLAIIVLVLSDKLIGTTLYFAKTNTPRLSNITLKVKFPYRAPFGSL